MGINSQKKTDRKSFTQLSKRYGCKPVDEWQPTPKGSGGQCHGREPMATGFTLIELLVAISIIGLLATAAVIGVNTARSKARDGFRKANADQIKKALELYYNNNGQMYPQNAVFSCLTASSPAGLSTYINPVPTDPVPARNTIALGCPNYQSDGLDYKLRVNLELDTDTMVGDGGVSASWYEVYSPGAQLW